MKVKELEKTVNLAWSPRSQYPILLAAGTTAQQLDSSFSTTASLDLYSVNLGDPSMDLELRHSITSEQRFHKLAWGEDTHGGLLVGGCDGGHIFVYNPAELLKRENGIIADLDAHSGAVRALDFNSFQKNLLASGATESEIYIWDLNNLSTPMTPGTASQPPDDVLSLSWNKQVQHILTTTFATRCMVWDLRKNEPIIKLTDTAAKSRWRIVTWNPLVATQLCLASEEDEYPVIQLWDLRYATSPMKTFEGHQKGVLSVSWSNDDPDLLISCGKDNKLLVWNPNTTAQHGEIVCDMTINTNWNFEVSWCPRNPFLVSTSSFDGRASVYSLSGGKPAAPTSNKIADSFPGMSQYPQSLPPQQLNNHQLPVIELLKPPKWMKKPVGVSFGFGGKLVSFGSDEKTVYVSQVVTEPDLMLKYQELKSVLQNSNTFTHCYNKAEQAQDPLIKEVWQIVACQVNGEESFRSQAIMFLGTSPATLHEKMKSLNINLEDSTNKPDSSVSESFSHVSQIGPSDGSDIFDNLATNQLNSSASSVGDGASDFEILKKVLKFPAQSNDVESALWDALLLGNIELAVKLCIQKNKWSDAIILAVHGGHELAAKTRAQYFKKNDNHLTTLISAIVEEDWCLIVEACELTNWRQVLVILLTYTRDNEFRGLCELLATRLLFEGDLSMRRNALICFVFAGNVSQVVKHWNSNIKSPSDVQELVELGMVLRDAAKCRGINVEISGNLAKILVQYAELLASQGYLEAAEAYLCESEDENILDLKERLMYAMGKKIAYTANATPQAGRTNAPFYQSQPRRPSQPSPYNPPFATSPYGNASKPQSRPPLVNEVQPPPVQPAASFPPQPPSFVPQPQSVPLQPPPLAAKPPPSFPPRSSTPNTPTPTSYVSNGYAPYSSAARPNSATQPMPAMSTASLFPPTTPISTAAAPASTVFPFSTPAQPPSFNQMTAAAFAPSPSKPPAANAPPLNSASSQQRSTPTPPAPPPSSQVPYNNARQTPDHVSAQGRSKYVLDPSVQGGGGFRNNFMSSGFPSMQPIMNQPQAMNPAAPFMPQSDSSYPMQSQNVVFPTSPPEATPYPPNPTVPPSMFQPTTMSVSDIPKMTSTSIPQSPPGWNDPPSVSYNKPVKVQPNVIPPANPITHPLYGAVPENNPMNPMNNAYPPAGAPPQQLGNYSVASNSFPQNNSHQRPSRVSAAEEMKPKPALPEKHIHLQTVLDTLRQQCYNKTMNMQMKRKLEDVARKLEMLYDAIRENKLSTNTLAGLHEIVNAIQQQNYQNCLALHTQLVSGPDFATIASFMPGIKVLVQSALQLEVYI